MPARHPLRQGEATTQSTDTVKVPISRTGAPQHQRRHLAAAVAGQLHIRREQRLQPGEIALLGGLKEPCCQLLLLLAGGLKAGSALLDVLPSAGGELPRVVLALADDRRNLRERIVE